MMKNLLTTIFLTLPADAEVFKLNADSFDAFIDEHPTTLVKFFAPGCNRCKKLEPEWEAASEKLKHSTVAFAAMDITLDENKSFAEMLNITQFPTIKYFETQDVTDYDGGRTSDKIVQWVKKMTSEAIIMINGRHEVEDVKDEFGREVPYFGYEGSLRPGNPEFQNFSAFCRDHRSLIQCMAYPGTDGEQPVMELFRPDVTSTRVPFDWETTADEMYKFVKGERIGYFAKVTPDNYSDYLESGLEVIWFHGTKEQYDSVQEDVVKVARQARGVFAFGWLEPETMARHAVGMGLSEGPVFAVKGVDKGAYIGPQGHDISYDDIIQFVKGVRAGEVTITYKSQDVPEPTGSAVITAVGSNLDTTLAALDSYYLLITAPWSKASKSFAPVYSSLSEAVKEPDSMVKFVTIDGVMNDVVYGDVVHPKYPSLWYKPSGRTHPELYQGDYDVESLVSHVAEHMDDALTKATLKEKIDRLMNPALKAAETSDEL